MVGDKKGDQRWLEMPHHCYGPPELGCHIVWLHVCVCVCVCVCVVSLTTRSFYTRCPKVRLWRPQNASGRKEAQKSPSLLGIELRLFILNLSTVTTPLTNPGPPRLIQYNFPKWIFFVEDCTQGYSIHVVRGSFWEVDKGKVHPITCHEGTVSRERYISTLSLTSALDEGGWLTPRPGRFTPGKETRHTVYRRLGWPQGRSGRARKISFPPGFDPRTVQAVASYSTDYALPAHLRSWLYLKVNINLKKKLTKNKQ